ncbi:MAG: alpha-amylase [Clostridia bacterium]|nr:alpha-amylase [Clostridia bacterium]
MFKYKSEKELLIEERNNRRSLEAEHNTLVVPSTIAFVKMAEAGSIDDITATENITVFSGWQAGVKYEVNALRRYEGKLYRCIQAHTSQQDWTPENTSSLWKLAGDPAEEYPLWSQPIGAMDAYSIGDKVTFDEKHYVSEVDSNVWTPDTYGWRVA